MTSESTVRALADLIANPGSKGSGAVLRKGTVTAVSALGTVTVVVGSDTANPISGVPSLTTVAGGNVVWLLHQEPLLICLGRVGGTMMGRADGAYFAHNTVRTDDLNAALPSGFYEVIPNTPGAPTTGRWYLVLNLRHTNNGNHYASQMAFAMEPGQHAIYTRFAVGGNLVAVPPVPGVWSDWSMLHSPVGKADLAWNTPALINGWRQYNPSTGQNVTTETSDIHGPWQYRRMADGLVHCRGIVNGANRTTDQMFVLPAGYRPARAYIMEGANSGGRHEWRIYEGGSIHVYSAAGWISVTGVWYAEQ